MVTSILSNFAFKVGVRNNLNILASPTLTT